MTERLRTITAPLFWAVLALVLACPLSVQAQSAASFEDVSEEPTTAPAEPAPPAEPSAAPATEVEAADAAQEPASVAPGVAPAEAASAEAAKEAPASAAEPALDGATYQVRLRDLEQRVDELKEQIRRSHTRLSLLSDTILAGAQGGARAEIRFVNELSGAWRVVEAVFVLDGAVQYKKTDDTGALAEQTTIPIYTGSVPTGDHTLQVMLKLRGHGFGVFSYLRGLEATVRHDHSFTLTDGKVIELTATAWEQGGPTTPVEQQPDIRFSETIRGLNDRPAVTPASAGGESSQGAAAGAGKN